MKLKSIGLALALSSATLVAACGGGDSNGDGETSAGIGQAGASAQDSTEKKADAAPAKVKCPAKVDKSLTGPDIVGLKLGMTQAMALNVIQCHMPDALITYDNEWFNRNALNTGAMRLENQMVKARTGETSACNYSSYDGMQKCGDGNRQWDFTAEQITLATPGIPGNQTVLGVWRSQYWKEGEMPALAGVVAALTEKYGPYQREEGRDAGYYGYVHEYSWVTDSAGNVLSEAHPMMIQCSNGVHGRGEEGQSWTNGCGLSITAMVRTFRTNPDVVEELSIGMMDQTAMFEYGDAFQAQIDEAEAKRKADELENAQSTKVKL